MSHPAIKTCSIILLLVILGFGIYSNILEAPFAFDDDHIYDNPHMRATRFSDISKAAFSEYSPRNRPVGNITFALNYYFHQYDLKGYHVVNIIIHILNGIFLFFFIKTFIDISSAYFVSPPMPQYSEPSFIAGAAALIWLVHPVQTQSVTYIVQRLNSVAAMFCLLSFLLYIKGRTLQIKRTTQISKSKTSTPSKPGVASDNRIAIPGFYFLGSGISWLLALGSKQTSATLPFFIFLYEWYFFQNLSRDWLKRHLKYLIGIIILFSIVAFIYLGPEPVKKIMSGAASKGKSFTPGERVLTQFRVVVYYLSLIFCPHPSRLNLDYDFPISHSLIAPMTTLISLMAIVGWIVLAVYLARRERLISFCMLWFIGNLLIESSIIPLDIIYEHRVYLPSMLVCLLATIVVVRYIRPKQLAIGMLITVTVICALWTYERNRVWESSVALWEDCVNKSPNKARPHYNLGLALKEKGDIQGAVQHYTEALRIDPVYVGAYNNLGIALVDDGRVDDAIGYYLEGLRIAPDDVNIHNNLGGALEKQGRIDEAVEHYLQALQIAPDCIEAHYNLGFALEKQGRIDEAVEYYLEAIRINPEYADAHINLGNVLGKQGRIEDAAEHYSLAIGIKPDIPEAHNNLGLILLSTGNIEDAIYRFREAVRIRPDYVEAHNNIGVALYRSGNIDGAISRFREAMRINPDYVPAKENFKKVLMIQQKNK